MTSQAQWTVIVALLIASSCVGHRSQLTKITRRSPSFCTLHSVTLWYEPLERGKPLPTAKKTFNFSRSEHSRALATFATSNPRTVLNTTFDTDTREAAALFAERITMFAEQKKKEIPPFTYLFRMSTAIKNIAVTVRLSRSKSQKLRGDITLHGYLREPSPELLKFITAAVIDDAPTLWRTRLSLLGVLLAGWKWLSAAPPTQKCDAAIQTEYEEEALPVQDNGFHTSTVPGTSELPQSTIRPATEVAVQTQKQEMADAAMQTESTESEKDAAGGCKALPLRRRRIISSHDRMSEVNAGALYGTIMSKITLDEQVRCSPWEWKFLRQHGINPNRALNFNRASVLDDGSILFTCTDGCARVIIHNHDLDLKRLALERESGPARSDLVFILYCGSGSKDKYIQTLRSKYEALRPQMKDFVPCILEMSTMKLPQDAHDWRLSSLAGDEDNSIMLLRTNVDYVHKMMADFICSTLSCIVKFGGTHSSPTSALFSTDRGTSPSEVETMPYFKKNQFYKSVQHAVQAVVPQARVNDWGYIISLPPSTEKTTNKSDIAFAKIEVYDSQEDFDREFDKRDRNPYRVDLPTIAIILLGQVSDKVNCKVVPPANCKMLTTQQKRAFDVLKKDVLERAIAAGYACDDEGWTNFEISLPSPRAPTRIKIPQ